MSSDAVIFVIDALNRSGAPYLVTGALATNLYVPPRSSIDADFVVEMSPSQLESLFSELRPQFDQEGQMAFETVTGKLQHRFRHRDSKFLIEIFEAHMDDAHERARFERRRPGDVNGQPAFVPTAEDVVIQKLRWLARIARPKDRDDARKVLLHRWNLLDWNYLSRWCKEHGTELLLGELKAEVQLLRSQTTPSQD